MFKSATFKLTVWYMAIVVTISIIFSVALYAVGTDEVHRGLHSETQSISHQFPVFQGDPMLDINNQPYYTDTAHRILIKLVGFNLIVLVLAGASSYWLARRTLEPIEAAHEQQKRFTSDVSHELRTPLTAIRMESEVALINDKAPANELRSTIESNLEEVGKLESLINNLLRLSRLEANELQQNFLAVNSKDVVEQAISNCQKQAANSDIKLETSVNPDICYGDQDSIVQLICVLIDNAIKYSPKGASIKIETSSNKDDVIWKVIDHGMGIEPSALKNIFNRFYRADSSRNKTDTEGFGLGLSIAKMISDIHNGRITISSKLEEGTTATVTIPKNLPKK